MNTVLTRASAAGRRSTLTRPARHTGPTSARGSNVTPSPAATQPKIASSVPNSSSRGTAMPRRASSASSR